MEGKIFLLNFFSIALVGMIYFNCSSLSNFNPLPSANNVETSEFQTEDVPEDLLITLERTVCYGTCPNYKLTVKADGKVLFEGTQFTKTKGKVEGEISKEKVRQLFKEFKKANYFNLNGKYDCDQVTDNPSAITSIRINSKIRSIVHYFGCREGSDEFEKEISKLTQLENKIDEIVETERWIGEGK